MPMFNIINILLYLSTIIIVSMTCSRKISSVSFDFEEAINSAVCAFIIIEIDSYALYIFDFMMDPKRVETAATVLLITMKKHN